MQNILIAVEDAALLESLCVFLRSKGFEVLSTSRPSTVFKLIHIFHPAVIILNSSSGLFDGRDIGREIKKSTNGSNIHIIIIARENTLYEYTEDECDYVIKQPINTLSLIDKHLHFT